jgi:hypothetical protein
MLRMLITRIEVAPGQHPLHERLTITPPRSEPTVTEFGHLASAPASRESELLFRNHGASWRRSYDCAADP